MQSTFELKPMSSTPADGIDTQLMRNDTAGKRSPLSCSVSSRNENVAMPDAPSIARRRLGKVPDVSRIGNWSDKTTRRLIDAGKLPGVIRIGRMVRVDLDILGRWIEQGCPHLHRFSGRA